MKKRSEMVGLITLAILLTGIFWISFTKFFPVNFNNNSGTHSWLSGSTIKFVNNWLLESPTKLHFLNIENPKSIEFNSLTERDPYLSYPSGCTFVVYTCAKIFGKTEIDINFLKHLQCFFYFISCLLFAFFVYRFLSNLKKTSIFENFVITLISTVFWMWMPTNTWYLANIFFADQCIILFVNLFILLEFENYCCKSKKLNIFINIFKSLVVFVGVQIDYYFWILVFIAFVLNLIRGILNKQKISSIIITSLWYVIPVILSIGFYLYQLTSVPNWQNILKNKFLFRTGIADSEYNNLFNIIKKLILNFCVAFGLNKHALMHLFISIILIYFILQNAQYKRREKKLKDIIKNFFVNDNIAILLLGIISPILQILFLKNHSAIHEFSMVKLSWSVAFLPIILSCLSLKIFTFDEKLKTFIKWEITHFLYLFLIYFLMLESVIFTPFSAINFCKNRYIEDDYILAQTISENTKFQNVCFSFSKEIPINPPNEIAISNKRVYKIDDILEIETYFPKLNEHAIKTFIIVKEDYTLLTETQKIQLDLIYKIGDKYFENDLFCFVNLNDVIINSIKIAVTNTTTDTTTTTTGTITNTSRDANTNTTNSEAFHAQ